MPRVTSVIVSDYQRDRVQRSSFYRGESRTFTVNFAATIPDNVYIASAKWQVFNNAITIISGVSGSSTETSVNLTAGYAGPGAMTCTAYMSDGSVVNQQILIDVQPSPWYTGDVVPTQGPQSLIYNNPSHVVHVTGHLPGGRVDESASYQYSANGGTPPYTFGIVAGQLPPGLTMNTAGLVTGTRTEIGTYAFTVQATDFRGVAGTGNDSSKTSSAVLPPTGGTANLFTQYDNNTPTAGIDNQAKGQWYFLCGTVNQQTGLIQLRSNGPVVSSKTVTPGPHQATNVSVGNSTYAIPTLSVFTGLMWGAGVINGAMTDAEAGYLYNDGHGRRFEEVATSTDPNAVSLWSKTVYAWQLDDDDSSTQYIDVKGNQNLDKTGSVINYEDPVFGQVALFPPDQNTGVLRANNAYLPLQPLKTYFVWAYPYKSTIDPSHVFSCLVVSYDGVSNSEGLNMVSNP